MWYRIAINPGHRWTYVNVCRKTSITTDAHLPTETVKSTLVYSVSLTLSHLFPQICICTACRITFPEWLNSTIDVCCTITAGKLVMERRCYQSKYVVDIAARRVREFRRLKLPSACIPGDIYSPSVCKFLYATFKYNLVIQYNINNESVTMLFIYVFNLHLDW